MIRDLLNRHRGIPGNFDFGVRAVVRFQEPVTLHLQTPSSANGSEQCTTAAKTSESLRSSLSLEQRIQYPVRVEWKRDRLDKVHRYLGVHSFGYFRGEPTMFSEDKSRLGA